MVRNFGVLALTSLGLAAAAGAAVAQAPLTATWQEAIRPGGGVSASGVAQEFAYTAGPGGVTAVAAPSTNLVANVRQTYGGAQETTSLEILDTIRTVTFARANGDTFGAIGGGRGGYARASDWSRQAVVADPLTLGWKYQSFAAWQTGLGQSAGSMGATSFGRETGWTDGISGVPQTGAATFAGFMGGIYSDAGGQDHAVTAEVGLRMDFAGHAADFFTANTVDRNGQVFDDLNISGTFVGLPNFPQMFGSLSTARLQGVSSGRFFGPAAEEFGGVFTLTPKSGEGLERLAGAFGSTQGSLLTPKAGSMVTLQAGGLRRQSSGGALGLAGYDGAAVSADVALSRTMDAAGATSQVKLTVPMAGGLAPVAMSFSKAAGDQIAASADGAWISAATERGLASGDAVGPARLAMANAETLGWDYQTFGAWSGSGSAANLALGHHGAASFGAATPDHAIPASGVATFQGQAAAAYAGQPGAAALATASVTLGVDFAARAVDFSTSAFADAATGAAYAGSALAGTMTYLPGRNILSGQVRTLDAPLAGTLNARFYGPAAQEIGGAFTLDGPVDPASGKVTTQMIGAFGAKR